MNTKATLFLTAIQKEMQYMRADYQTLTRRSAEEKVKASDFAIASFARALLTVPDILTTALKHVPQPIEKGTPLHEFFGGVELTKKSLLQTLDHHGVKPMDATVGTQFDPENHEAIFQVPAAVAPRAADGSERKAGEIMEVTKEGWMIKNRVLRPAQVGVVQIE
jgi:molecular chaperone GrpE